MKYFTLFVDIVNSYSENEFFEHFRVSQKVAHDISLKYTSSTYYNNHEGQFGHISAYNQVCKIFLFLKTFINKLLT